MSGSPVSPHVLLAIATLGAAGLSAGCGGSGTSRAAENVDGAAAEMTRADGPGRAPWTRLGSQPNDGDCTGLHSIRLRPTHRG